MNLTDFNTNFTVTIVAFDDTTSNVSVHFKVKCNVNDRVSLHTAVADTTLLSEEYTDNDVVTAAWNTIKTTVNTWASFNITEDPVSVLTITSTSNAISLSTFNTNFTVKVTRFEMIPSINPTHWSIHLLIYDTSTPSLSTYYEGLVPLTSEYCNNTLCSDIADAAWELVKNQACDWASQNLPTESVVDTIFVPASV